MSAHMRVDMSYLSLKPIIFLYLVRILPNKQGAN